MKRLTISSVIAVLFVSLFSGCTREKVVEKPNMLLIVLDTLRADHLGVYGYERDTSPNLDIFARENVKFDYAISAAPWTPASVASMFTGLYPASHQMMPPDGRDSARALDVKLNSNLETVAEALSKHGYRTGGVTSNPWTNQEFSFDQGFDHFRLMSRATADQITAAAKEMITQFSSSKEPFFAYLHYLDPHDPYRPPPEYADLFKGPLKNRKFNFPEKMVKNIGLYDGEIKFMDHELGKLFAFLKEKGLYEDLVIVIVGDHGEQFMQHGDPRHGYKLYNDEVHVPLLLKTYRKADRGRSVATTVSTVDIYPSLLELAGLNPPSTFPGIPLYKTKELEKRDGVFSEVRRVYDMKSFVSSDGKKIILQVAKDKRDYDPIESLDRWRNPEIVGVFDRYRDYEELEPLQNAQLASSLRSNFDQTFLLASQRGVAPDTSETEVSEETIEQLKSLGYLQ